MHGRSGWNGGGEEGLFMVPYFLSQHPLSSRGKSIPKVKGQPEGIPFVPCRRATYTRP